MISVQSLGAQASLPASLGKRSLQGLIASSQLSRQGCLRSLAACSTNCFATAMPSGNAYLSNCLEVEVQDYSDTRLKKM